MQAIHNAVQRFKSLTEFEEPSETVVEIDPDTMALIQRLRDEREWKHDRESRTSADWMFWNAG
jgi:hypothetical protein|tara:strand:+ start:332 stop:520 length:189 start_codon:yes stop_codon:yes gene_type:complete